jgi:hypothetical protein
VPWALNDRLPSKRALFSSSKENAAFSASSGVNCPAGSELPVGCCLCAAGVGSSDTRSRALLSVKKVAPKRAAPRRARRMGREMGIAAHIGSPGLDI